MIERSRFDNPIVIYHDHCMDGFMAQWLFYLRTRGNYEPRAAQYGRPLWDFLTLEQAQGREVFIVDFSFPREQLLELSKVTRSLVVLDHHETAREQLSDLPFATFHEHKSGCRLAWEYLWDRGLNREFDGFKDVRYGTPWWPVLYAEDRDLWRWQLDDSEEVNAWLRLKLGNSKAIEDIWQRESEGEDLLDHAEAGGRSILDYQNALKSSIMTNAFETTLLGYHVWAVNSPVLQSELGHALSFSRPFGVVYFQEPNGEWVYSLRSQPTGENVRKIAERFGGGGHDHAAGFKLSMPPSRWVDKNKPNPKNL